MESSIDSQKTATRITNKPAFLLASAAAFALLLAAYANHFDNSYHFDDSHVIQNNLYIHSLSNIPLFFTDARANLRLTPTHRTHSTISGGH